MLMKMRSMAHFPGCVAPDTPIIPQVVQVFGVPQTSYALLLIPIAGMGLAAWIAREPLTPLFLSGSSSSSLGLPGLPRR